MDSRNLDSFVLLEVSRFVLFPDYKSNANVGQLNIGRGTSLQTAKTLKLPPEPFKNFGITGVECTLEPSGSGVAFESLFWNRVAAPSSSRIFRGTWSPEKDGRGKPTNST